MIGVGRVGNETATGRPLAKTKGAGDAIKEKHGRLKNT